MAYRLTARPRLRSASTSRSFGGAFVTSASISPRVAVATSSTACSKAASFARDGFVKPLIFRTYCSAASRTSSSVAGGSKLKSVWMFRHMRPSYALGTGRQRGAGAAWDRPFDPSGSLLPHSFRVFE